MIPLIKKGAKKIKLEITDKLFNLGIKKINIKLIEPRILIYHGVTKNARTDINARFISTELFEKQIIYFKSHFNIVPLYTLNDLRNKEQKPTISISFDDGYQNNLKEVFPILDKHKVPATIFITTVHAAKQEYLWADLLDLHRLCGPSKFEFQEILYQRKKHEYTSLNGTLKKFLKSSDWNTKKQFIEIILKSNNFIHNKNLFPYFKLLSPQDIKTLSESEYIEIGSHGVHHNCLDSISIEEAKAEMKKSKHYLESIIEKEVTSFAYPDGRYNASLTTIAEQLGYKNQYVVDYKSPKDMQDKRINNRFGINPYISFNNQIKSIIDGKY